MGVIAKKNQIYTVAEYLEVERRTGERYEFYNGKIKIMAGAALN